MTTAARLTSPGSPAPPSFSTRRTCSPWTGTSKRHPMCTDILTGVPGGIQADSLKEKLVMKSEKSSWKDVCVI